MAHTVASLRIYQLCGLILIGDFISYIKIITSFYQLTTDLSPFCTRKFPPGCPAALQLDWIILSL